MTQSKHTEGPWITDGGGHVQALYIPNDGGKPFYHTIARTDQPLVLPEQCSANSLLITAAPELLAALGWAMGNIKAPIRRIEGQNDDYCNNYEPAIAALAKATGAK